MKIGILAVQGAFAEHKTRLEKLGADCFEIRNKADLEQSFDGLVLPGGESTVQGKLLRELGMFDDLKNRIEKGLPVLATCAGLILLAEKLENDETKHFATLPVTVERNAFGRQLGSFYTSGKFGDQAEVPMTFIRAPVIKTVGSGVQVLSVVKNLAEKIVAVRYKNQLAMSFHPELNESDVVYEYFLKNLLTY